MSADDPPELELGLDGVSESSTISCLPSVTNFNKTLSAANAEPASIGLDSKKSLQAGKTRLNRATALTQNVRDL